MRKLILLSLAAFSIDSFAQQNDVPKSELALNTTELTADTTKKSRIKIKPNLAARFVAASSLPATYSFTSNAKIEIQNYKADGTADGNATQIRYHFASGACLGTEINTADPVSKTTSSTINVADFSNKYSVNYMTDGSGNKTGTAMSYDYSNIINSQADTTLFTVTKTGNSKRILNYMSEEYVIKYDDGGTTQVWVSADVPLDMKKIYYSDKTGKSTTSGYPQGFIMEMTSKKSTGEKTIWKTLEINPSAAKTITTADYTFPN